MKYVGLDLAGSPSRPTGACVITGGMNTRCAVLYDDDEIVNFVRKSKAKFVAIDAPLALPKGRHCLGEHCRGRAHFRACDRVLSWMGIRFFPITIGPMRTLTARGMRLKKKLERIGCEVFETFPGAAQDLLGIPRKQRGLQDLQRGLLRLGCKGDIAVRDLTGDELDSVNCALVARDFAEGSYLAIGDPSEVMMILPRVERTRRSQ
jgi:predicted nuclease with RNAse H fold